MKANENGALDRLFEVCRGGAPWSGRSPSLVAAAQLWTEGSPEPDDRWNPMFAAEVWARIEGLGRKQGGWVSWLSRWAPSAGVAALAAAAILGVLLWVQSGREDEEAMRSSNYVEVLMLNSLDEHDGAVWMAAWSGE